MPGYEYKVIPAPRKPGKIKGVRGTDQKFAASLAEIMNRFGRDGWEYQRTDTLPCEERQGFTGRTTVFQNMLVFRRVIPDEPVEMSVRTPTAATAAIAAVPVPQIEKQPEPGAETSETAAPASEAEDDPKVQTLRSGVAASAAPALAAASHDAPQGKAPRVGAPNAADGGKQVSAPTIAAQ